MTVCSIPIIIHYKLATFSRRQKPMCLLGENFQYGLLGEKGCNFIMTLSSGEPQPIFSNVAFGPSALRQHWKILALAHHLIMVQYILTRGSVCIQYIPDVASVRIKYILSFGEKTLRCELSLSAVLRYTPST